MLPPKAGRTPSAGGGRKKDKIKVFFKRCFHSTSGIHPGPHEYGPHTKVCGVFVGP